MAEPVITLDQETKTLLEDLNKGVQELRAEHEAAEAKGQETVAEHKQFLDRMNDRLDELEVRVQKSHLDSKNGGERTDEQKAFELFCRKGVVGADEQKVLREANDTTGGYLAPPEFVAEMIKGVIEYSPLRQVAYVRKTSAGSVRAPKRTATASASWIAEQGTRSETTNPAFGVEEIPVHELYALSDVSFADLEDAVFDLEEFLNGEYSEQFGVAEGTAFISGNAVGKPEGILTNSNVSTVTSTSNDVLHQDDFAKLFYQLKEPYHTNAVWLLNRLTVRDTRLLKASGTGDYVWTPGFGNDEGTLVNGSPGLILGHPYLMATDMPTVADAAKAIAIGDWKKAYWIVDRIDMAVQRDPFTQAASGNVRFHARKRVGGQVVVPEAIKILVIQ